MNNESGILPGLNAESGKKTKEAARDQNRESLLARLNAALHRSLEAEFRLFWG